MLVFYKYFKFLLREEIAVSILAHPTIKVNGLLSSPVLTVL